MGSKTSASGTAAPQSPPAGCRTHLDVRVAGAGGAPDAGAALLFPVREELGPAQHRDPAALEAERQRRAALQPLLVLRRHRQHDGDAQVHHSVCTETREGSSEPSGRCSSCGDSGSTAGTLRVGEEGLNTLLQGQEF